MFIERSARAEENSHMIVRGWWGRGITAICSEAKSQSADFGLFGSDDPKQMLSL
jgi:hypothetical protein